MISESIPGISFAKQFLRAPRSTGAVTASSPRLIGQISQTVDFTNVNSIVELGPGSGVITEEIARQKQPDTCFIALELNPEFAEQTRLRCPEVLVYADNALNIQQRLHVHDIDATDCVVSALPWALFDAATQRSLVQAIASAMTPEGIFIFYAYAGFNLMPASVRFRSILSGSFACVEPSKIIWGNLPPAIVYTCSRRHAV